MPFSLAAIAFALEFGLGSGFAFGFGLWLTAAARIATTTRRGTRAARLLGLQVCKPFLAFGLKAARLATIMTSLGLRRGTAATTSSAATAATAALATFALSKSCLLYTSPSPRD